MATGTQINCPFCNAAQAHSATGTYVCDFCLQPFNHVDAKQEESRLLEEIKQWLNQTVGGAGMATGNVDESSRAFIFREKILPELRRDVNRSLETLGSYGQHALIQPPVPMDAASTASPLVIYRHDILALRTLRARLESEQVGAFARSSEDKTEVQALDRRIADVQHLSNVAEAGALRSETGYATARRNLEAMISQLNDALTTGTGADPGLMTFLGAMVQRYRALADACRVCEECCGANLVDGATLERRLSGVMTELRRAAADIEASGYDPAETMPIVIGIGVEAQRIELQMRWLRTYAALARSGDLRFQEFVGELNGVHGMRPNEDWPEFLDACSQVVQAIRGEHAVSVVHDDAWIDNWVERSRQKKTLGMFGNEEQVADINRFMLPVWVADVSYSKSKGAVFKEGVEQTCVIVVDACSPSPDKVRVVNDEIAPVRDALSSHAALGTDRVALPTSTAIDVHNVFSRFVAGRADMVSPKIKVRGLAFISAVVAHFDSKKGPRELPSCLGGLIPMDVGAETQMEVTSRVMARLGA